MCIARWSIGLAPGLLACVMACGGCMSNTRLNAYHAYHAGQVDAAQRSFATCVEYDPADWRSRYYLGVIALERGDPVAARRHLELAYSLRQDRQIEMQRPLDRPAPSPPVANHARWPRLPEIIDALAEAIDRQGEYPQLIAFLDDVAQTYGTPDDFVRLGAYLEQHGDHDAALIAYRKAARIAGDREARPYVVLADFYDAMDHRAEALEQLRRAYGIDPNYPGLADRLRAHGLVPGPTVVLPAEQ